MVRICPSRAFFVPLKEKTWHYLKNTRTIQTQLSGKGQVIGLLLSDFNVSMDLMYLTS